MASETGDPMPNLALVHHKAFDVRWRPFSKISVAIADSSPAFGKMSDVRVRMDQGFADARKEIAHARKEIADVRKEAQSIEATLLFWNMPTSAATVKFSR